MTAPASLLDAVQKVAAMVGDKAAATLLEPGSLFSLASLATALLIALLFVLRRRLRRGPGRRPVRARALLRALFPRDLLRAPSTKADLGFFLFNTFMASVLFGGAVVSGHAVSAAVHGALDAGVGARTAVLPGAAATAAVTLATFLAYEFGYWLDHYLKHRIPFLWEFHKVHHTAEHLTPLTNFRLHPVDSLMFANILALAIGATHGAVTYALGREVAPLAFNGSNAILVVFLFLLVHLQHTQLWIAFTGVWGRVLISPAHHQLHHSSNPEHFGRNFGSCLAVWDWLFGTLAAPTRKRQTLTFGVSPISPAQHTFTGGLITPFVEAFAGLAGRFRRTPFVSAPSGLY